VRSGLISIERLSEVALFDRYRREALAEYPQLHGRRVLYETIRRMLSAQVYDVIDATRGALEVAAPADADAARRATPLVLFTKAMRAESTDLKRFLFHNLYRHPQVIADRRSGAGGGARAVRPHTSSARGDAAAYGQRRDRHRAVARLIAGMTDRFAMREHRAADGASGGSE
jgi:dGTPase